MWAHVRRLFSVNTLFALLGSYVVASASAIAFLDLEGLAMLLAFVTLGFAIVTMGVVGAYVRWLREEVASMNSPPPEWDREEFAESDEE